MATPNYGYEKRQKELAKRKKKEDKLKDKAARKLDPGGNELAPEDGDEAYSNVAGIDRIPPTPPALPTKDS